MSAPGKVATIAPGLPFVDVLAAGIVAAHGGDDPLALTRVMVLLPTRRAVRALREAFLRLGDGRPMLLPLMRPIGDVDEDELALTADALADAGLVEDAVAAPEAVSGLRRQLMLATLIAKWWDARRAPGDPPAGGADQAARLAGELARLIDQMQTARVEFSALEDLVPDIYAQHWRDTLEFLAIVSAQWPDVLAENGWIDPAARRNAMIEALTRRWRESPPHFPVIAAGSTGSIPATADLLAAVATLPMGTVVLPGLDRHADAESWEQLTESHPQFGLKLLLDRLGLTREAVVDWPATDRPRAGGREKLVSEVMRPEATTQAWRDLAALDEDALDGLSWINCPDTQTEAGTIALLMREALGREQRTAALVTSDRELARRVAAELQRWDVSVDDSAGQPLADTRPGVFLRLIATVIAEDMAPVPLLALLKHPLAAAGDSLAACRARARALERACLRGPRPEPGLDGIARALVAHKAPKTLIDWWRDFAAAAAPLVEAMRREPADLQAIVAAHAAFAEWLATSDAAPGADRLWAGEAGEACAMFVEQLGEAAVDHAPLRGAEYAALFDSLMAGWVVRPRHGAHPRLSIWGPLEARLQQADLVIVGGLNESSWPRATPGDPWLSRPMRASLGLPQPERMIGLAAHDFAQLFCAPQVVLTRSARSEGAPTVPSRWLVRLDTVLRGAGLDGVLDRAPNWPAWQAALDRPDGPPAPVAAPAPRPPVAARPRALSVTRIEAWMRDPYEIFARHILRLKPFDVIDADPTAADYGSFIHHALDEYIRQKEGAGGLDLLLAIGREVFGPALAQPGIWAFWWPRFERIARWFIAQEQERGPNLKKCFTELRGELTFEAPAGRFVLSAKADRIDLLSDGGIRIIDYKTGMAPSDKEVAAGFAPQLPLEAAIAAAGGFEAVPAGPVAVLEYWRLSGGDPAGKTHAVKGDAAGLGEEARAGLEALVTAFDDPATPYPARPAPQYAPRFSDYEHLARVQEWSKSDGDGE
jgi:ATP-dependent helicase/nuclease subunit B